MNLRPSRSAGLAVLTTVVVVAATGVPAGAHLVADSLPAGTSISVSIDEPRDAAILPQGPVTVTGTAAVGEGEPNTALVYVLDVSLSTDTVSNCPQSGDNILDCEIAASIALNGLAIETTGAVGAAVFASDAAQADVQPSPPAAEERITGPGTDENGNSTPDIEEVLASASFNGVGQFTNKPVGNGTTNFAAAVNAARAVALDPANTMDRTIVAFMSDGLSNAGGDVSGPLATVPANVDFYTFAIGAGSNCASDPAGLGSLQEIANATGGECRNVPNVGNLPDDLLEAFASELSTLTLDDGIGAPTAITNVTPPLPQEGPASVTYTATTDPLPPGVHELCVTAAGSDAGGNGDVTDCHTVTINAPPQVDAGGPYGGQEGSPVAIAGSVVDPDSPGVTAEWSYDLIDADPGTECEFADGTDPTTTVTCTDDGDVELTLTADDGINPPVADTAILRLSNVAPAVDITTPAGGAMFVRGTPVAFQASFTDPGDNDTHTCTVNFDDGTPVANGTVAQSPGSGTCSINHSFTAVGPHDVLVTVTDDNGGFATDVVRVVIFRPGEAFAIQATGLVTIPKTPHATCPPDEVLTQASLNLAIAVVNALNASCTVDPDTGETVAAASIDQASLLGGAITISNIESTCVSNASGVTRTSSVGTINGTPIGIGSGSITIPLVATVFYNETTTNSAGQLVQNAIRVQTLLGQQIILAGCRLG